MPAEDDHIGFKNIQIKNFMPILERNVIIVCGSKTIITRIY